MSFQSSVAANMGFGVVGELMTDSPHRAIPAILDSADAAYNIFGRAFCIKSEGVVEAGGSGIFAGILSCPKQHASPGTTSGPLAPTLTLPNNVVADIVGMGEVIVSLPAAAAIGDQITYNTTTGALGSITPRASFTGVIAVTTGVLTVSARAAGGYIGVGSELSGTGVPGGTRITAQLTGTAGSNGTYQTNIDTAVASTAMTVPNSPLASGAGFALVPNAEVWRYTVSGAGLAVIKLTN